MLKIFYASVLLIMLVVSIHAQSQESIFNIPKLVQGDPWFQATLFDAYFAFLSFYFWVYYKENSVVSRILWLIAILLLGNIAMSVYALKVLLNLKPSEGLKEFLLSKSDSIS